MPSYSIAIANQQRVLRVNRRRMIQLAKSVLAMEHVEIALVSVAIVDDPQIHAINRDFLKHDFPTDVISFLLDGFDTTDEGGPIARLPGETLTSSTNSVRSRAQSKAGRQSSRNLRRGFGKWIDGEIIISADTALRIAGDYDATPHDELALYLAHGLLHLCGYDDLTPQEKRLMRRREAEALEAWNSILQAGGRKRLK